MSPDVLHLMTRRDILDDNVDLLARAARLIRQWPSFQLSVKPVGGEASGNCCQRRVEGSIVEGGPGGSPAWISREWSARVFHRR